MQLTRNNSDVSFELDSLPNVEISIKVIYDPDLWDDRYSAFQVLKVIVRPGTNGEQRTLLVTVARRTLEELEAATKPFHGQTPAGWRVAHVLWLRLTTELKYVGLSPKQIATWIAGASKFTPGQRARIKNELLERIAEQVEQTLRDHDIFG